MKGTIPVNRKVILISIDGMRPDGFLQCGNSFVQELLQISSYALDAHTVFPPVTLPCHMSLFYGIPPQVHGMMNNALPTTRPSNGLFEQIKDAGGVSAMFYGWGRMRDVCHPMAVTYSTHVDIYTAESVDTELTDLALERIRKSKPDFVYLYMLDTDDKGGHDCGWMTDEYLRRISIALDNVKRVWEECHDEYTIVITADHGGHERMHGIDIPEDMTIPQFYIGPDFEPGKALVDVSILDTAPTIAKIMGIPQFREWEGKALI